MSDQARASPVEEYNKRLEMAGFRIGQLESIHYKLGYVRVLLAASMLVLAWSAILHRYVPWWSLGLPIVLFLALGVYHSRVLREQTQARRVVAVFEHGIARIEDRWKGKRKRTLRIDVSNHLYANDLDIVGDGGLFELLCTARTHSGEDTLLEWLLSAASLQDIFARQVAITELREDLSFREYMATSGPLIESGADTSSLLRWAEDCSPAEQKLLPWLLALLAAAALTTIIVWLRVGILGPMLAMLASNWIVTRLLRKKVRSSFEGMERAVQSLGLFSTLLRGIEERELNAPLLAEIRHNVRSHGETASQAIARLGVLMQYRDASLNLFMRTFNLPLLYSVQLALALGRWKRRHGPSVRVWLESLGQMEALLSLATYSYEHPSDPFPEFLETSAHLRTDDLGHPLIATPTCVRNSLRLGWETKVLLVSGSNMSGKSTLMRAVGVNVVLAMCGAPVRAGKMELAPMLLGTSLLVNDSLQNGSSRFYTEIERLQRICSLAEGNRSPAVLFLLDELLQGTNSSDRLVGATGVVRSLVYAGAIGIATTHDLSLVAIGTPGLGLTNMHFQDEIVDGKMSFDFQLRDGMVTKSNGTELMRMIGLKV